LLDVTWASGYQNYSGQYVQQYNNYYFLTPPDDFIRDHYPEDPKWTLLTAPPILREYAYTPFKNQAFSTHKVVSFKPSNGIIEANVGDTLTFELETEELEKKFWIADTAYADSSVLASNPFLNEASPNYLIQGNKIIYTYPVTSAEKEWLNLILNGDAIMRYKLNVKKNLVVSK